MPKLPSVSELMVGAHLPSVLDRSNNQNHVRHSASSPRSALPVSPHERYPENAKDQQNTPYHGPQAPLPAPPNALPHRSRGTSFSGPMPGQHRPTDYFSPNHHVHLPPPQQLAPQHPGLSQSSSYEQPAHHVESPLHMSSPKQARAASLSHPVPPQHYQQHPVPPHLPQHQYSYPPHPHSAPLPPNGVYARQEQPGMIPQHVMQPGMVFQGYGHPGAPGNVQMAPYGYNVGLPPLIPAPIGPQGYGKHGTPHYANVPQHSSESRTETDQNNALVNKRRIIKRRTRTGCLTCRKRRIKCDERKPHCYNCERSKKLCLGYEVVSSGNKRRNSDHSAKSDE